MKTRWHKRALRGIRGRLRARVLARHGVAIIAESRNGTLAVDPGDFNVARSLLERGEWDWREITLLGRLLEKRGDLHLVFVGTHIGSLLVPIVRDCGALSVVAFEPSPANYRLLKLNLKLNGLAGVDARQLAIGQSSGQVRFTQNPINTGNSRVARDRGELEVPMTTLDAALPPQWTCIDLLVMDIEGFEVFAMAGGEQSLQKTRYFYVEYAPEQLSEQGSSKQAFIDAVARRFSCMYLLGPSVEYFAAGKFADYLGQLPERRGLLLNLLFANDTVANPRLLAP
jgi:FkbM family methyltransferase